MKKVDITVLGPGCPNCIRLETMCREAIKNIDVEASINKITDHEKIADHGVYLTPGLIINEKLVLSGKMPTLATLENWIKTAAKE
ncbi:MAG: thioredoxin family protein [Bacteroidales bacterium]|nr:thioredoxin family protein [Bacteroidales bacterium]